MGFLAFLTDAQNRVVAFILMHADRRVKTYYTVCIYVYIFFTSIFLQLHQLVASFYWRICTRRRAHVRRKDCVFYRRYSGTV